MGAAQRREKFREYIADNIFTEDKYSLAAVLSYCPLQSFFLFLSFPLVLGNYLYLHSYRSRTFYCMLF